MSRVPRAPFFLPSSRAQPLKLDCEVGGRNNLGEIDCQSNVAGWVRSSDDAVILVDELPKRRDQLSDHLAIEDKAVHMNHRFSPLNHIINHRVDITPVHIDRSDWPEAGLEQ